MLKIKPRFWMLFCLTLILGLIVLITVYLLVHLKNNFDAKKIAESFKRQCQTDKSIRCFGLLFNNFSKKHSFEQSYNVLNELKQISPQTKVCHTLAHAIATEEVTKNPSQWEDVFTQLPFEECSYGYIHGILEGKYRSDPNFKITAALIDRICNSQVVNRKNTAGKKSCSHGFGHILIVQQEGDVETSLNICRKTSKEIQYHCFGGVFMENIIKEDLAEHEIDHLPILNKEYLNTQKKYCNSFLNPEQTACWERIAIIISPIMNSSKEDSIRYCLEAKTEVAQNECIMSVLGTIVVAELKKGEKSIDMNICDYYESDKLYKECIKKVETNIILSAVEFEPIVRDFCNNLKVPYNTVCHDRADSFQ